MTEKATVAMKVTPESLRVALATLPEVGEMHVNEVLGGYLVLNAPRFNKNGTISRRPPKKYILISPEVFFEDFEFVYPQKRREFGLVTLR